MCGGEEEMVARDWSQVGPLEVSRIHYVSILRKLGDFSFISDLNQDSSHVLP